jgi:hypothetical protein
MNRTKIILILTVAVIAAGATAFAFLRSPGHAIEPTSPTPTTQGISATESDPATTSEPVPQLREDGIVPLPTDAVGVWKPDETKKN